MNIQSVDYISSKTLDGVKYYRKGYDFKGWALSSNGTVVYQDKDQISKTIRKSDGTEFTVNPLETVNLYAVWEEHVYSIDYSYLCGTLDSSSPKTYTVSSSVTLKDLIVSGNSDNSSMKCSGDNEITAFDGWYTDTSYAEKELSFSGTDFKKDITLYALEHQKRYYDYSRKRWIKIE